MRPVSRFSLLAYAMAFAVGATALPSLAQPGLRNTFPGRRVGGGTRGECSARLIAHLVPADSVFAAGPTRLLGILQGPSANPYPMQTSFRPQKPAAAPALASLTLPASPAGIVLIQQPKLPGPTLWESTYQCPTAPTSASDDPFSFISAESPPALSLLLPEVTPADSTSQQALQQLRQRCGGSISREEVARLFGMADVIQSEAEWPAQLPVRCPS